MDTSIKDINLLVNNHITNLAYIKDKTLLKLIGQVRNVKKYGSMILFDLSDSSGKIKCKIFKASIEENKIYTILGILSNGRYGIEFNTKQLQLMENEKSLTDKLIRICEQNKYFDNKKLIDFMNIKKITILSKENTQGYNDFIHQLKIPIDITCVSVCLEGPNTSTDIISKLYTLQDSDTDLIIIMRGGGDTTEISRSFDKIEMFDAIKKSKIPVATSIGHFNDSDKKLVITKISDKDFPTPTSAAQFIKNSILEQFSEKYKSIKDYYFNKFSQLVSKCNEIHNMKTQSITDEIIAEIDLLKSKLKNNLGKCTFISDPGDEFCIKRNGKYYKCNLVINEELNYDEKKLIEIEKITIDNLPKATKYELDVTLIQDIKKRKSNINRQIKAYENLKPQYYEDLFNEPNINNYKKIKQNMIYHLENIKKIDSSKIDNVINELSYEEFQKLRNEFSDNISEYDNLLKYKQVLAL